ncbi:hypothetical protein [Actinoplanes sp. NPDC051494]|uniref:hypothetical protein n=1 Tax=Actinoplanes sp. NPDC051494 TaxID=3363907 RepID=UPI00379FFD87
MAAAITVAALIAVAGLLSGMAIGWRLRRTNDTCAHCGGQLSGNTRDTQPAWSHHEQHDLVTDWS